MLDPRVYEMYQKYFKNEGKWQWLFKSNPEDNFPPYDVPNAKIKSEVIILDSPSNIYHKCETFKEMINMIKYDLDLLLNKDGVSHLHYLMDMETPIAKYVDEPEKTFIEKTPFQEFSTTNPYHAWKMSMLKHPVKKNNVKNALQSISGTTDGFDFAFPAEMSPLLENRDYKQFLSYLICEHLFSSYVPPVGRTVFFYAPNFRKARNHTSEVQIPKAFLNKYQEADYQTVWIANQYCKEHHVTIYSRDGDVVLAQLLGQTNRMISLVNGTLESVQFGGQVVVVNHWREKCAFSYININNLWFSISNYALERERYFPDPEFKIKVPVATVVAITLLNKNDYVLNFPKIGPVNLFEAFFKNIGILGLPMVKGVGHPNTLRLNASSFLRLIFYAYFKIYSGQIQNNDNLIFNEKASFAVIQKALKSSGKNFTMDAFKVKLANVYWFMQYMIAAQHGEEPSPPAKKDENGISIYGYSDITVGRPVTGRSKVIRPEKVSIKSFIFYVVLILF